MPDQFWSKDNQLSRQIANLRSLPDKHALRFKVTKRICPELIVAGDGVERYKSLNSSEDHELIIISRIIDRLVEEEHDRYVSECKDIIRHLANQISESHK